MKTSNQLTEPENAAHPSNLPIDPFAVDFFGGTNPLADENEPFLEREFKHFRQVRKYKKSDWYKILPQITNAEAELSTLLQNLPENLTEESAKFIGESVARYTFQQT